ncbi:hypothetical protein EI94DRAFT_1704859 [Lactarius quietus]|nr:hypothetical protein EI94DRAFT_1704859 [Lactarius quietus]
MAGVWALRLSADELLPCCHAAVCTQRSAGVRGVPRARRSDLEGNAGRALGASGATLEGSSDQWLFDWVGEGVKPVRGVTSSTCEVEAWRPTSSGAKRQYGESRWGDRSQAGQTEVLGAPMSPTRHTHPESSESVNRSVNRAPESVNRGRDKCESTVTTRQGIVNPVRESHGFTLGGVPSVPPIFTHAGHNIKLFQRESSVSKCNCDGFCGHFTLETNFRIGAAALPPRSTEAKDSVAFRKLLDLVESRLFSRGYSRHSTSRTVRKPRTPKDPNSQNETKRLLSLFSTTLEHLASFPKCTVEILIIDDGTPDCNPTAALLATEDYRKADIHVVQLERNRGNGGTPLCEHRVAARRSEQQDILVPTDNNLQQLLPATSLIPSKRLRLLTCAARSHPPSFERSALPHVRPSHGASHRERRLRTRHPLRVQAVIARHHPGAAPVLVRDMDS